MEETIAACTPTTQAAAMSPKISFFPKSASTFPSFEVADTPDAAPADVTQPASGPAGSSADNTLT
jgi:hypothetical protein